VSGQVILFVWTVAVLFTFAGGIRLPALGRPACGFEPKRPAPSPFFSMSFAVLGSVAILGRWFLWL